MRDEIIKRNMVIIVISLVIFFFASLYITSYTNRKNLENQLLHISNILENHLDKTISEAEIKDVINKFTNNQQWLSVVIANSLGDYIIDSSNDDAGFLRRLTEKELAIVHKSAVDGDRIYIVEGNLYYISKINDDVIVRTSIELEDNTEYILISIFYMLILIIGVFLATIYYSKKTSDRITDAFLKINRNLKLINEGEYQQIDTKHRYYEVSETLGEINKNIYNHIVLHERERERISFIINNVRQGIIVIDENERLMFINSYAIDKLRLNHESFIDENYRKIIDISQLEEYYLRTLETKHNHHFDFVDELTDKIYDFRFSYQHRQWTSDFKSIEMVFVLITDVTENRKLEDSRAEFIANASHELKTPITTVLGFSELILTSYFDLDQLILSYIDKIHSEAIRMKNSINELLYLSNLENHKEKFALNEEVNLRYLCEEVIVKYQDIASKKNVSLIFIDHDDFIIYGIESLIVHMLNNLVENAINYNVENGKVWLSLTKKSEYIYLKIKDTGIGMKENQILKIFDRFYRADESRSRTTGGTGLGLPIVKKICAVHNAKISVESKYGEGTEFTVSFFHHSQNSEVKLNEK